MPPRHPPLELDRLFSYRISVLSNRLALGASRLYGRRFGLVLREWRVLALLGQFAPMSARDIIERSALDKASVSRAVASLAERSLVRTRREGKKIYYSVGDARALAVLGTLYSLYCPIPAAGRREKKS